MNNKFKFLIFGIIILFLIVLTSNDVHALQAWNSSNQTGGAPGAVSQTGNTNYRIIVLSTSINQAGSQMRACVENLDTNNYNATGSSICLRSGTTDDCTANTLTRVTFNSSNNWVWIPGSDTVLRCSDWINYPFNNSQSYLFSTYLPGGTTGGTITVGAGSGYRIDSSENASVDDLSQSEAWSGNAKGYQVGAVSIDTQTPVANDSTVPTFSTNITNNTAPKIYQSVNFSITIADETALSSYIFAWDNGTGTFVNDTAIAISGTSFAVNVTKTIQRANGTTMQWRWHANDTNNNWNVTTIESFVVINTLPTVTLNKPADGDHMNTNGSVGNNLPFNFTVSDPDNATTAKYQCDIMYNSSGATPNLKIGNNASVNNGTLTTINSNVTLASGRYAWLVTCADNTTYVNSSTRTVVIDPDIPLITWTYPALGSTTKLNSTTLNLNIQCTDLNLERNNITIKNNATGAIIYSNLSTNLTSTTYIQNASLSLGTNSSGNYTIEMSCADDVSGSPKINDTLTDIKKSDQTLEFKHIKYKYNNKSLEILSQYSLNIIPSVESKDKLQKVNVTSTTSNYNPEGTHIKFGFTFTVPKDDSELVLNISSEVPIQDRSNQSGRKGHLMWGNYFTDFSNSTSNITVDGILSHMVVTTTKINDFNYEIKIGGESPWLKNQVVFIDPVTGGLNVQTETTNFLLDLIPPYFTSNSTNNTAPKINQNVNFSITITDVSSNVNGYFFSWDNGTGTFVNDSFVAVSGSNVTVGVIKTIQRVKGTTIQWKWHANDTVNLFNVSNTYSTLVQDTASTFTSNSTNNTAPKINQAVNFSIVLTDPDTLAWYIFSWDNGTGTFVNDSIVTLSGTTFNANTTKTIQRVGGTTMQWKWYVNDSVNTITGSSTYSTLVANTQVPTPTGLNFMTTGGFNDSSLTLGEIISWVNATCTNDSDADFVACTLSLYNNNNATQLNNVSMTGQGANIYSYSTAYTPDSVGTWTLNVTAFDGSSTASVTTTFLVATKNVSSKDGWFGFTEGNTSSNATISNMVGYGIDLVELTVNASRITTDWNTILERMNHTISLNIHLGLNVRMDFNTSSQAQINNTLQNISDTFINLTGPPYSQAVEYLSFEINNSATLSNDSDAMNQLASRATTNTTNLFSVYSKNLNSTTLDTSYLQYNKMRYINSSNLVTWIESEKSLARNGTTLNRIYSTSNATVLSSIQTTQKNIYNHLRGTLTGTAHQTAEVGVLSNNDTLIFNNLTTAQSITINVTNLNGVIGESAYDSVNKVVLSNKTTNGILTVNVSNASVTMIFFEPLSHTEMGSLLNKSTLFNLATTGNLGFNYTHGASDTFSTSNFALDGAHDAMIELYDPNYVKSTFVVYYGWLNASYINFTKRGCDYSTVIFSDQNNALIDSFNYSCGTRYYGYISVGDFNNTEAWQLGKQNETDNWLALNGSLDIFIDGLDTGVGGANFSNQFKRFVDYNRVSKGRKVIVNTYTAYTNFCGWADGCMKESCVQRWNGSSSAAPLLYDRETWQLEVNKSLWYNSHGVTVYCQSFSNRTSDTFQILNYTDSQNLYFASKVLGYANYYESQPDFNYAHTEYFYNVGSNLDNKFSTDDNITYYRRYSNGIVYYNSSSELGWIDDGRNITSINITMEVYDNGFSQKMLQFSVNRVKYNPDSTDNIDYTIANSENESNFVWINKTISLNLTDPLISSAAGRYVIEAWVSPRSTTPGQGWNLMNEINNGNGLQRSWSDTSATDSWSLYALDQNWHIWLTINATSKVSVDTTSAITQTNFINSTHLQANLSSSLHHFLETWTYPENTNFGILKNTTWYNGTAWVILATTNTTDCDSSNPTFNYTTINATYKVGSCYKNVNASSLTFRFSAPELSTQQFSASGDTSPPTFATNTTNNTAPKINQNINFSIVVSDDLALSSIIYSTDNGTGTFLNDSAIAVSGTSYNVNVTKTIQRVGGTTIQWKWYANDTTNNWASSTTESFVTQNTQATFTSNITNNTIPKLNQDVQFNITLTDADTINGFIFAYDNGTNLFINDSFRVISSTSATVSINKTIQRTRSTVIVWKWYLNDSTGAWNSSSNYTLTVANTPPTTPNILAPGNNSNQSSIPISLQYNATDADLDTITYFVFINGTKNGTTTGNWSFNASDSTYTWNVIAGDTFDNSSNSSVNQFILDTTAPTVTLESPANASTINIYSTNLYFNVTELHSISNCTLYVNNAAVVTSNSITKSTSQSLAYTFASNANYYWNVSCLDNFNQTGQSSVFNLTVSVGKPAGGGGGGTSGDTAVETIDPASTCSRSGMTWDETTKLCYQPGRLEETQKLGTAPNLGLLQSTVAMFRLDKATSLQKYANDGICQDGENPISDQQDCHFYTMFDLINQQNWDAIFALGWFWKFLYAGLGLWYIFSHLPKSRRV